MIAPLEARGAASLCRPTRGFFATGAVWCALAALLGCAPAALASPFIWDEDTDRIDDNVMVFRLGVGSDGFEIIFVDDAHSAPFHLLEEAP